MNFKTFSAFILILLIAGIASAAYATYVHSAIRIGDGKDIDLNSKSIGNGSISGSDTSVSGVSCAGGQYLSVSGSTWSCGTPAMNLVNASSDLVEEYSTYGRLDYMMNSSYNNTGLVTQNAMNVSLTNTASSTSRAGYSSNRSYTLESTSLVANFRVTNMTSPSVVTRTLRIGLKDDFNSSLSTNFTGFEYYNGNWRIETANATLLNNSASISIVANDRLSLVANSTKIIYYVNSVPIFNETLYIPISPLHVGAIVIGSSSGVTGIDINYLGFKKY